LTATATTSTSEPGTRRVGHAVALAVDAALLVAVNAWPGWRVVPFLTEDVVQVLDVVNLALVAGVAAHAVHLLAARPVARAVADLVTITIGLVAAVRVLQVLPFAFPATGFDWSSLVWTLLVLGVVGTAIAVLGSFGSLIRLLAGVGPRS
jgi:hypothetical protein